MANLYTHQDSNIRKTWFLMTLFFLVVLGLGWAVSLVYNAPHFLYIAFIFSIFMNVFSYWYSDKIVIKMTGAKLITRDDNKELWNVVENLSITAGLPMPKLYIIEDSVPNAFATGRNPENSAVAVSTGLLQVLDRNELEGVIAHELSHIGNRDILLSTIVVVLVGFISIISDFFLRSKIHGGGDNNKNGGALMVVGIVLIVLSPIIASLIQLAISRKREFLADASGALLTRYPEGLASALEKISLHSGKMQHAHNATAHLYIHNPFGERKSLASSVAGLFQTHPPTIERVKALRGMQV
jgi:heat shock protein HtpX